MCIPPGVVRRTADDHEQVPPVVVHRRALASSQFSGDDLLRQGADDEALEPPPQGPGAELGVVGLGKRMLHRGVRDRHLHALLAQPLTHIAELESHDLVQHRPRERVEHNNVVQAVQQLGSERPADGRDALLLRRRHILLAAGARRGQQWRLAHVRGHNEHRVRAIHRPPLRVRDAPVVQQLQQHIEDVGVRLLQLVEEDHGVGVAAERLRELAALLVADVTGGGTDEPRHSVFLHVFGHVQADHLRLAVEELRRQGLGHLRLPHSRGARKEEGTHGPIAALQLRGADEHGPRNGVRCLVLPKHTGLQRWPEVEEALALGLRQPLHRDARPSRDDLGNVLRGDHLPEHGEAAGLLRLELLDAFLQAGDRLVAQVGDGVQVAVDLRELHLALQDLQLLLRAVYLGDERLLVLETCLQGRHLVREVRQLALGLAEALG
mmetsp:Transcript_88732/g.173544  ORF Transcript_88732/g.173544 Transcript_88732/m.173544 type:complete len:436 (-) Transcript_88732:1393-2700(-)